VLEVRRIIEELPGVESVYASSAFHTLEVTYDPARVRKEDIQARLNQAGYLGELPLPVETGIAATADGGQKPFFRHTAAYEQTRRVVSFEQQVPFSGRPLWPCPGMGVLTRQGEEA
jgi:copper chaperone CopZ